MNVNFLLQALERYFYISGLEKKVGAVELLPICNVTFLPRKTFGKLPVPAYQAMKSFWLYFDPSFLQTNLNVCDNTESLMHFLSGIVSFGQVSVYQVTCPKK